MQEMRCCPELRSPLFLCAKPAGTTGDKGLLNFLFPLIFRTIFASTDSILKTEQLYFSMKKILFLLAFLWPVLSFSQDERLRNYDYVYLDFIKSVQLNVQGLALSMPIINLNSGTALELSFDDLEGDVKNYTYMVVQCNADWTPSGLIEPEYIDGFPESDIRDFAYSFKVKTIYTNYKLSFPNNDMQITKSGNYLLKVYENEGRKRLAITRRFMVVEPVVSVIPRMVRPAQVSKGDTHQEVDFTVTHKHFEIRNPRQELSVTVLQNGRWDNAITGLLPMFSRQEEQIYDYQDKVVFNAGKEFRYADLRGLRYGTESIAFVEYIDNQYEVVLRRDEKRSSTRYLEIEDINGNFVIETFDENDRDLESEYANVLFSLYSPTELYEQEVYIFGKLTDWQLKPEFKMVYNPAISSYVGKVSLKQGYYNYLYATLPRGADRPDFEETEGDWFETRNTYTVLVYYRPFGGRYDQLIGSYSFGSRI